MQSAAFVLVVCAALVLPAVAAYRNLGESASGETASLDAGGHSDWLAQRVGEGTDAENGMRQVDQEAMEDASSLDQKKLDRMRSTCKNISVGALEAVKFGSALSTMQQVQNDTFKCTALVDVLEHDYQERAAAKDLAKLKLALKKLEAKSKQEDKNMDSEVVKMTDFKSFKNKTQEKPAVDDSKAKQGFYKNAFKKMKKADQKKTMKAVGIDPKTGKPSKKLEAKESKEDKKVAKIEKKMEKRQREEAEEEDNKTPKDEAREAEEAMKLGDVKESKAAKNNDRREEDREQEKETEANQEANDDANEAKMDGSIKVMRQQKENMRKAEVKKRDDEDRLGEENGHPGDSVVASSMYDEQDEEEQQEQELEAAEQSTYRRNDFDRNEEIDTQSEEDDNGGDDYDTSID